jgi:putative tryptophan/tyrosine transport system substrate-binding protein
VRRREFITVAGAAAMCTLTAQAQQRGMPVIGILHSQTRGSEAARLAAIAQGLNESGLGVDRNVAIEHRFADGHNDRLPILAADLVRMQVDVILANTTPPAIAAKAATATIPIVFVTGVDPVEMGLVASFNRPGGNITGVTFLSNKLVAKRLELLTNLVPGSAAIGMLAAQLNPNTETDVRDALAAANVLGRTLHVVKVPPDGDLDAAIAALVQQRVGSLFIAPQADVRIWRDQLLALALRHALPTSFASSDIVTAGGFMSYGPDQNDSYREAGNYVARILKGEKPTDLPVLVSTKFEFVINLRTAKALSLTIPPSLLAIATNVIE